MSAPSPAHEYRRRLIEDAAALSGLTRISTIGHGLIPDVVRRDASGWRLLVGDAKDSETPGCAETECRLRRYSGPLLDEFRSGVSVRLILAVRTASSATLVAWAKLLERVSDLPHDPATLQVLDGTTSLVWMDLRRNPVVIDPRTRVDSTSRGLVE